MRITSQTKVPQAVDVSFVSLDEISSYGAIVSTFPFPTKGSSYSTEVLSVTSRRFQMTRTVAGWRTDASILTEEVVQQRLVQTQDQDFFVGPNSLKWTLRVSGWKFQDLTNGFVATMRLSPDSSAFLATSQNYSTSEKVNRYTLRTPRSEVRVSVPLFAIVDGALATVFHSINREATTFTFVISPRPHYFRCKLTSNSSKFRFQLPAFRNYLEFDPEVTIIDLEEIVTPDSSIPASETIWRLVVGIAGGLIALGLLIVFIYFMRRFHTNKRHERRWKQAAEMQ
jgi:hypothetical protein